MKVESPDAVGDVGRDLLEAGGDAAPRNGHDVARVGDVYPTGNPGW